MWSSSFIATLHYLAIAMGFGAVFMRGRYFKALSNQPQDEENIKRLLAADNFWGVAALLWIVSGLLRTFGGFEKGTSWYMQNPLFHLKMGLFILVFLIEIAPMVALIRLRVSRMKKQPLYLTSAQLRRYRHLNHTEAMGLFLILVVASAMARGLWMM